MNTPPFKVGQKVVCVEPVEGVWVKDSIYTVATNHKCPKCGEWHIQTEETPLPFKPSEGVYECTFCESVMHTDVPLFGTDAKSFRAIEESRSRISYVAVSESLRQTAIEIAAVETN